MAREETEHILTVRFCRKTIVVELTIEYLDAVRRHQKRPAKCILVRGHIVQGNRGPGLFTPSIKKEVHRDQALACKQDIKKTKFIKIFTARLYRITVIVELTVEDSDLARRHQEGPAPGILIGSDIIEGDGRP